MAIITGTTGNDNLPRLTDPSTAGDDIIYGLAGNDTINGGAGNDTMEGGADHDIYYVDSTSDVITEAVNAGIDTVYTYASYTLGANVENLYLFGSAYYGYGNALNNYIVGNSGNNYLWGSLGIDTMVGGLGNDVYSLDSTYDVITEGVGAGTDTVYAYANYTLGANIENLYLYGSAYYGYGNALNNYIVGNSGNNYLWGAAGNDTIAGGLGSDRYDVDSTSDVVIEGVNAGIDIVYSYASYTLSANVENLHLLGSAYYGYGNELSNRIWGNAQNNYLWGGASDDRMEGGLGNDIYSVDNYNDVIVEGVDGGTDSVYASTSYSLSVNGANVENLYLSGSAFYAYGNELNNYIEGSSGNNTFYGLAGNDTMAGGLGDDAYLISGSNDVIIEGVNAGTDSVTVSGDASYTLGANLENLYINNSTHSGYGNALNNYIQGSGRNNYLSGGDGNDTMNGDNGDDTIDGGAGNDTMSGGTGNDIYYVDSSSDVIVESAYGGYDSVHTYVSYTLSVKVQTLYNDTSANNVENLYLYGSAYSGYGNALNNYIQGNSGNNYLWGGGGTDLISGGDGNDSISGGNSYDTIIGGDGNDSISGGEGNDVLTGGAGADYFTFSYTYERIDTITDFSGGEGDKIALSASGFGSGLTTTTGLTPGSLLISQFVIGAEATNSNHRIIYNSSSGALSIDQDGVGTASSPYQFATLSTGLALTSSDFHVF